MWWQEQRGLANSVTYGCMLDACVKCGNLQKAVEVFKGMRTLDKQGPGMTVMCRQSVCRLLRWWVEARRASIATPFCIPL